jgi:hypothetical protein
LKIEDEIRQLKADLVLLERVTKKLIIDGELQRKQINTLLNSIIYTNPNNKNMKLLSVMKHD